MFSRLVRHSGSASFAFAGRAQDRVTVRVNAALMFPEEQEEEAQLQRELSAWGFIGGIASSPKQRAQHRTLCA